MNSRDPDKKLIGFWATSKERAQLNALAVARKTNRTSLLLKLIEDAIFQEQLKRGRARKR